MNLTLKMFLCAAYVTLGYSVFADTVFSDAKWKEADSGNFFDTARWDNGTVPVKTASAVVNGYVFNKESPYSVYLDKSATLNFLYIGSDSASAVGESAKVTFVVTNDLLMSSVANSWTGYKPESGVEATLKRRSLELNGTGAELIVKDGAKLTVTPEIPDNTWVHNDIGLVSQGAKLFVTNAEFRLDTLNNPSYGNDHLQFEVSGTLAHTSVIEVVDASVDYINGDDNNSYGNSWKFREYSRGIFTDTTLNMGAAWDLSPTAADKPVPEILLNGDTLYNWTKSGHATIFNGGHIVFDDNACFTNRGSTAWALLDIGPAMNNTSMHLEFRGNSTFAGVGNVKNDSLRLGLGDSTLRNTKTRLTIDTTGEFSTWAGLYVGNKWGTGCLELNNGTLRMGGNSYIYLGYTDNNINSDNQCVTGRLDITGGVIDANYNGNEKVNGLVVGGAFNLRGADATDYYSYGEVNITGGSVSNRVDVWVGTGMAKGVFRQSAGEFISNGHLVLGAGGGEGEMHILGGSYTIQNAWAKPGSLEGQGAVYIGGISRGRLEVISRLTAMPVNFPYDRSGYGYLCVSNASFFVGTYGENVGTDIGSCGTGVLELKNASAYSTSYMAMTNGANSRLKFTLSGADAPQLTVREQLSIGPGAKLIVDARGYKGNSRWVQLVKFARGNYPNKYYQGWGFSRNGKPADWTVSDEVCDLFDENCIETFGSVEIFQIKDNPDNTGRAAGIWAHINRGFSVIVR